MTLKGEQKTSTRQRVGIIEPRTEERRRGQEKMEGRHRSNAATRDASSHQKLKEAGKVSPGISSQPQPASARRTVSV